ISTVCVGVRAVLRLCLVWNKIFTVAGIIDRVRPYEIRLRSETMQAVQMKACLQSMVRRTRLGLFLVHIKEIGIGARSAVTVDAIAGQICRCNGSLTGL